MHEEAPMTSEAQTLAASAAASHLKNEMPDLVTEYAMSSTDPKTADVEMELQVAFVDPSTGKYLGTYPIIFNTPLALSIHC